MSAGRWSLLLLLVAATPLTAQQRTARDETRTTLRGVVVDALRGDPLPNAMVRLVEANRGVLTDSLGRFVFLGVPLGPEQLAVKQYGYAELGAEIDVRLDHPLLQVELDPGPVALQGFDVVADRLAVMKQRLRNRRNAAPVSVHALDQDRLSRSAARDMVDFLAFEAGMMMVPCAQGRPGPALAFQPASSIPASTYCVIRRGQTWSPRVFIDEAPTIGGVDELAMYKPYELHLVEVYSSGLEIRAYTHNFMERMARRPMTLIPVHLP